MLRQFVQRDKFNDGWRPSRYCVCVCVCFGVLVLSEILAEEERAGRPVMSWRPTFSCLFYP